MGVSASRRVPQRQRRPVWGATSLPLSPRLLPASGPPRPRRPREAPVALAPTAVCFGPTGHSTRRPLPMGPGARAAPGDTGPGQACRVARLLAVPSRLPHSLSSLLLHILGGPGPKRPAVERPGGSGQAALLAEEKKTRLQKTHFLELLLNTATACSFRKHFARAPHPVTEPRVRPASRAATIPAADRQLPAGGRRVPTAAPGLLGGAGQAGPAPRVLTQRL